MTSEIKSKAGGQISIYIAGREPLLDVDFPTAIMALDKAYTEDMAALISATERCMLAMDAALTQLESIRRAMEGVIAAARARHIEGAEP